MELRKFMAVIWKYLWLILLAVALVAGSTYFLSITMTPIYQATTVLCVQAGASDPTTDLYRSLITSERLIKTYVEMMQAPDFLAKVIAVLGLEINLRQFQEAILIEHIRDTQLIRVSVEDPDPVLARDIANKIAELFIQEIETKQAARFERGKRDLDEQITELEKKIEETQKAIASLGDPTDPQNVNMPEFVRQELARLQTELSRDQNRYSILLESAEDFRLAMARYADNIAVVSSAEVPTSPVKPRILLNTVLGLISGAVLGVSTAFLLDYLDDTIKTAEDVSEVLGLTTLGNIIRFKGVKELRDGLVTALKGQSPAVEAYRVLRTNIQFSNLDNPSSSLLITSAAPREGKTTTMANLGIVMAQAGKRVILVDADLRHPTLHDFFQVPREPGLTDLLLEDDPDIEPVLQDTEVKGLRVLTSGLIPPNPAELLGSQRMARLVERLKERADVVLFDSPPVLAVTDASLLAAYAEDVLLVVEAGKTRRETGRQAKEALAKVNAHLLGVVLNKQQAGRGSEYYYYYYHADGRWKRQRSRQSDGGRDGMR